MIISEEDFNFIEENIEKWNILVVDDDEGVLNVTEFILEDIEVAEKPVELHYARSAKEALEVLNNDIEIAVILLDVVMESTNSGLDLVETIRDEIKNQKVRILLRTGQPGHAPETEVVQKYDIDDYLSKAELSETRLITSVTSALRSFAHILHLGHLINKSKETIQTQEEGMKEINSFLQEDIQSCETTLSAKRLLEILTMPQESFELVGDGTKFDKEILQTISLLATTLHNLNILTSKKIEFLDSSIELETDISNSDLELMGEDSSSDLGFLIALLRELGVSSISSDNGKLQLKTQRA